MNFVHPQAVAGGRSVSVTLTSSNATGRHGPTCNGHLRRRMRPTPSVEFRPLTAGQTTLSVSVPQGFSAPAQFASVAATVLVPGMAVTRRYFDRLQPGDPRPRQPGRAGARRRRRCHSHQQRSRQTTAIPNAGSGGVGLYYPRHSRRAVSTLRITCRHSLVRVSLPTRRRLPDSARGPVRLHLLRRAW